MYVVYCQNKPMSEFIVSEYIDTFFEVSCHMSTFCASILLCTIVLKKLILDLVIQLVGIGFGLSMLVYDL